MRRAGHVGRYTKEIQEKHDCCVNILYVAVSISELLPVRRGFFWPPTPKSAVGNDRLTPVIAEGSGWTGPVDIS